MPRSRPAGKHVMNIFLQYTPYTLSAEVAPSWHAIKESYADRVMDMIEEYAPGFKSRVLHRHVLSPLDLEEEYGMTGGNIFHGEMSVDQLFSLRPVPGWAKYRTPIRGLYLLRDASKWAILSSIRRGRTSCGGCASFGVPLPRSFVVATEMQTSFQSLKSVTPSDGAEWSLGAGRTAVNVATPESSRSRLK